MEARRLKRRDTFGLPRLVFMTDDARVKDPVAAIARLPRDSLIVFRDYGVADRKVLGRAVVKAAHARGHKVLVAGDWRLAWALGADGVHLPEYQAQQAGQLKRRRPDWIVTAAAHSASAVRKATRAGVDAVFLSPIFPTQSHGRVAGIGVVRATHIINQAQVPVYALGGVDAKTARLLQGTRLYGFAAIGALL